MSKETWYIYRHLKADTGYPFYIGLGKKRGLHFTTIEAEYSRAYVTTRSNRSIVWSHIYIKHGVIVEILLDGLSKEEARVKEQEFITLYGRFNYGGILCNITEGGEGTYGLKHSSESKHKMSVSAKNRKKKRSEESRKALSRFILETRSRKIICFETGEIFKNRYHVQERLFPNVKSSFKQITRACEIGRKYKGLSFHHLDENEKPIIIDNPRKIPGEKLNKEARKEIQELYNAGWTQPKIAAKFNVDRRTILRLLNGKSWKNG
jgi:hypothetical protein